MTSNAANMSGVAGAGLWGGTFTLAQTPTAGGTPSTPARQVEIPGMPASAAAPAGATGAAAGGQALQAVPAGPVGAGGAAPARQGGLSDFTPFALMGVLLVVMVATSVLGGRKEKKKREELLKALSTNDRVQTLGGIIGTVVELRDDEVVLRVDENTNTRIRFAKSAVQQVLRKHGTSASGGNGSAAAVAEVKPSGAKVGV